jgi:hypothetical protein
VKQWGEGFTELTDEALLQEIREATAVVLNLLKDSEAATRILGTLDARGQRHPLDRTKLFLHTVGWVPKSQPIKLAPSLWSSDPRWLESLLDFEANLFSILPDEKTDGCVTTGTGSKKSMAHRVRTLSGYLPVRVGISPVYEWKPEGAFAFEDDALAIAHYNQVMEAPDLTEAQRLNRWQKEKFSHAESPMMLKGWDTIFKDLWSCFEAQSTPLYFTKLMGSPFFRPKLGDEAEVYIRMKYLANLCLHGVYRGLTALVLEIVGDLLSVETLIRYRMQVDTFLKDATGVWKPKPREIYTSEHVRSPMDRDLLFTVGGHQYRFYAQRTRPIHVMSKLILFMLYCMVQWALIGWYSRHEKTRHHSYFSTLRDWLAEGTFVVGFDLSTFDQTCRPAFLSSYADNSPFTPEMRALLKRSLAPAVLSGPDGEDSRGTYGLDGERRLDQPATSTPGLPSGHIVVTHVGRAGGREVVRDFLRKEGVKFDNDDEFHAILNGSPFQYSGGTIFLRGHYDGDNVTVAPGGEATPAFMLAYRLKRYIVRNLHSMFKTGLTHTAKGRIFSVDSEDRFVDPNLSFEAATARSLELADLGPLGEGLALFTNPETIISGLTWNERDENSTDGFFSSADVYDNPLYKEIFAAADACTKGSFNESLSQLKEPGRTKGILDPLAALIAKRPDIFRRGVLTPEVAALLPASVHAAILREQTQIGMASEIAQMNPIIKNPGTSFTLDKAQDVADAIKHGRIKDIA